MVQMIIGNRLSLEDIRQCVHILKRFTSQRPLYGILCSTVTNVYPEQRRDCGKRPACACTCLYPPSTGLAAKQAQVRHRPCRQPTMYSYTLPGPSRWVLWAAASALKKTSLCLMSGCWMVLLLGIFLGYTLQYMPQLQPNIHPIHIPFSSNTQNVQVDIGQW